MKARDANGWVESISAFHEGEGILRNTRGERGSWEIRGIRQRIGRALRGEGVSKDDSNWRKREGRRRSHE